MEITTFQLGSLQTNCYLLIEKNKCIIIDPADSADFLLEYLLRRNIELHGLLATHGHFDHILAAGEIQLSYLVPLYIGKEDMFLVERLVPTAHHFLQNNTPIVAPKKVEYFTLGVFPLKDFKGTLIHTPGHTPGSYSFYFPEEQCVFTGDTLFQNAIGSNDHSYSNKELLMKSVNKLLTLDQDTIVYPGHGETTIVSEEKQNMNTSGN